MWKDYSANYIKHNQTSGISIMAASFIAALFLSFLCSLFYNFWLDNIKGTIQEDGDWHGRITGEISEDALSIINCFANVEKAVVNEALSGEQETVVDITFYNKRTVYQDMLSLINALELKENAADYNFQLLSLYFIRIPGDKMPRLIMPLYLMIVAIVCFSLILVIHNSFAVSMNNRIYQFGIFSSIGATPGQVRTCLMQEAFLFALTPILLGFLLGFVLSFGVVLAISAFAANVAGGREIVFGWHPAILTLILLLSILTVLISAWLPARKLSRLTPLEAIKGTGELQLTRKRGILLKKHSPVLSALFGIEGELAGNALKAQKKALRTTSLSLTLAFLGFMLMQCFFTLSGISTNHTYFEAYQDAWDIMVTLKNTGITDFELTKELRGLAEVQNIIVYQKAETVCILPKESISPELVALGGPEAFAGTSVSVAENSVFVKAPIVILDDESFEEFCAQTGITLQLDGTIILNRFWDSVHSNFRYREYISYVRETLETITLQNAGTGSMAEIPVLACTQKPPVLREEYADYALVQFIPLSLWTEISGQTGGAEQDTYIRVLADNRTNLDVLNALEAEIVHILSGKQKGSFPSKDSIMPYHAQDDVMLEYSYETESENRLQEKITNDKMIEGYELILGAFCALLAIIGIAHAFSSTLGFLRQRRREFARYMSIGLPPKGMRKIFCLEALVLVGRPALTTLLLTIAAVAFMIKMSHLEPVEFIAVAPVVPVSVFILVVFGFVALAYYLGGRKVLRSNLTDALRDDTMV